MTGIERLRKLIEDYREGRECDGFECTELSCGKCMAKNVLEPNADQIERERDKVAQTDWETVRDVADDMAQHVSGITEFDDLVDRWCRTLDDALDGRERRDPVADVSVSAYDLLPADEREAIAWVREHGGIESVKEKWTGHVTRSSVKRMVELHEKKRDRLKAHALWLERKCHERRERINELERNLSKSVSDQLKADAALYVLQRGVLDVCKAHGIEAGDDPLRAIDDALDRRLMPEGMEWPRFEDGEPVRIGDAFAYGDETFYVDSIQLLRWEFHLWAANGKVVTGSNGERCERPESWERLEDDATLAPLDYVDKYDIELYDREAGEDETAAPYAMARDLVRRAKALAGRDA